MDEVNSNKSIPFGVNDQSSSCKNNNSHHSCYNLNDDQEKGHWRELLLESTGADDSGHFTASPETDHSGLSGCSGSSRGHSPVQFHEVSTQPQTQSAAALVLKAFREHNGSNKEEVQADVSFKGPGTNSSCENSVVTNVNVSGVMIQQMQMSGRGDDGSNSTDYLRTALENFNDLYKQKLRMVEDVGAQGDAYAKQIVMEKKASILECWAKDVCVQNIVLIHTVEELEKQGDEKLKLLQHKINESTSLAKQHMEVIKKYESKIRALLKEKDTSKEARQTLKSELDKLKSECKRTRDRVRYLEKDNDSLVALITRIRDMGVWDVAGLELHKRTYEQIFGLYPNLPGSEVQTVFTRDRAKKIQDTEEKVTKLEQEVLELTEHKKESALNLISKDSKITEMESELRSISDKLQHCQVECEHYKKSLIETQEKLLEATKELQVRSRKPSRASTPTAADAARHAEIQELLQELRDVKTQLSASMNESQTAKEEANMIRREFSERLRAMQESQQCLQSELTNSFETHNQMQEKELELQKIKEQIQVYQSKCDSTDKLLNKKDQMIDDLQRQIALLNEKETCLASELLKSKTAPKIMKNIPSTVQCGRDHSGKAKTANSFTTSVDSKNQKPPWNDNFVKASALDTASNLSRMSTSLNPNHSQSTIKQCNTINTNMGNPSNVKSAESSKYSCKHNGKTKVTQIYKSPAFDTNSSFSFCSCDSRDIYSESIRSSEMKPDTHHNNTFNLPTIDNKFDLKDEIKKLKQLKTQGGLGPDRLPHLPKMQPKIANDVVRSSFSSKKRDSNALPKIDNPLAHRPTYEVLMDVAVETSKRLLQAADSVDSPNRVSSIRVVAGHSRHRHKTQQKISGDEKYQNKIPGGQETRSKVQNRYTEKVSRHVYDPVTEFSDNKLSSRDEKSCKTILSLDEMLSELPEQSYMNVVEDWIEKSTHSELTNHQNLKAPKQKTPLLRKPINKNLKQQNGKRTPRPISGKSNASIFTAKKNATLISDIKEEWNRVFSHFEDSGRASVDVGDSLVKDHNGNISDSSEPLRGNERFTVREPGFGSVCLGDLLNSFEERKADAIKQLHDLRTRNNRLITKSLWMEKKIQLFGHLRSIQDILGKHKSNSLSSQGQSSVISPRVNLNTAGKNPCVVDKVSNRLVHEVGAVKTLCKKMLDQCTAECENVKLLSKVDESLKTEIAEIHWQLERFKSLAGELEAELIFTKNELSNLKKENDNLKKDKDRLEEELWTAKIEILDTKSASSNSGYFSPLKRLETMKEAFDTNEQIIKEQKLEISKRDALIQKYQTYCVGLQAMLTDSKAVDNSPEKRNVLALNERIKSLENQLSCARREKCETEKRVQGLTYKISLSMNENEALKSTVSSLSLHIEELIVQNETLISKLPSNVQDFDGASSIESSRSDVASNAKRKEHVVDYSQGAGDREFTANHLQIGVSGNKSHVICDLPIYECQSSVYPQPFDDLNRMVRCAKTLERSCEEIMSASCNLRIVNSNKGEPPNTATRELQKD